MLRSRSLEDSWGVLGGGVSWAARSCGFWLHSETCDGFSSSAEVSSPSPKSVSLALKVWNSAFFRGGWLVVVVEGVRVIVTCSNRHVPAIGKIDGSIFSLTLLFFH